MGSAVRPLRKSILSMEWTGVSVWRKRDRVRMATSLGVEVLLLQPREVPLTEASRRVALGRVAILRMEVLLLRLRMRTVRKKRA